MFHFWFAYEELGHCVSINIYLNEIDNYTDNSKSVTVLHEVTAIVILILHQACTSLVQSLILPSVQLQ